MFYVNGLLDLTKPIDFAGTIDGFGANDKIDLLKALEKSSTYALLNWMPLHGSPQLPASTTQHENNLNDPLAGEAVRSRLKLPSVKVAFFCNKAIEHRVQLGCTKYIL